MKTYFQIILIWLGVHSSGLVRQRRKHVYQDTSLVLGVESRSEVDNLSRCKVVGLMQMHAMLVDSLNLIYAIVLM